VDTPSGALPKQGHGSRGSKKPTTPTRRSIRRGFNPSGSYFHWAPTPPGAQIKKGPCSSFDVVCACCVNFVIYNYSPRTKTNKKTKRLSGLRAHRKEHRIKPAVPLGGFSPLWYTGVFITGALEPLSNSRGSNPGGSNPGRVL
jgi:hypothetical protein